MTSERRISRDVIVQTLVDALKPLDYVYALWEGGAVAFNRVDDWSDIDLYLVVDDNKVDDTFLAIEKALRCEGCQTVFTDGWDVQGQQWGKNCRIAKCLEEKELKFCSECDTYPDCEKFQEIYRSELRHGENLMKNLDRIRTGDMKKWLEEEEKKWVCQVCRKPISDYKECHWCGARKKVVEA